MNTDKNVSARTVKSDLARLDSHEIESEEYEELPELTDEMLKHAVVKEGGHIRTLPPKASHGPTRT